MLSQFVFVLQITNQLSFYPSVLQEISILFELNLGHLRYTLVDVPPQPNHQLDAVFRLAQLQLPATLNLEPPERGCYFTE